MSYHGIIISCVHASLSRQLQLFSGPGDVIIQSLPRFLGHGRCSIKVCSLVKGYNNILIKEFQFSLVEEIMTN